MKQLCHKELNVYHKAQTYMLWGLLNCILKVTMFTSAPFTFQGQITEPWTQEIMKSKNKARSWKTKEKKIFPKQDNYFHRNHFGFFLNDLHDLWGRRGKSKWQIANHAKRPLFPFLMMLPQHEW
jgi:hypothetical protein